MVAIYYGLFFGRLLAVYWAGLGHSFFKKLWVGLISH
jgi:hypothetical protein